jgi:hypothetical protein
VIGDVLAFLAAWCAVSIATVATYSTLRALYRRSHR